MTEKRDGNELMKKAFQRPIWPEHEQILRQIGRGNAHKANASLTLNQKSETSARSRGRRLKSRRKQFRYSKLRTMGLQPRPQVSRPIVVPARLPPNQNAVRYFPRKRPLAFA